MESRTGKSIAAVAVVAVELISAALVVGVALVVVPKGGTIL